MVRADIALPAVGGVCAQNFNDAGFPAAVPMGCLTEVAVFQVMHIADVGKGNPGVVLADDVGAVVAGICAERAGSQG